MINGKTTLLGLLGWPVSHSLSPAMHNAASADLGLNYSYLPLPVHPNHIAAAMAGLPALGFRGVNVTIPHKQAVMPLLSHVDEAAQAIGAVNTIVFDSADDEPHTATGYNTDWIGFLDDLRGCGVDPDGREAIVLGAGGSARAVVYALLIAGATVHLLARRPAQAENLINDLAKYIDTGAATAYPLTALATVSAPAPIIVNTTPLGMSPHIETTPWPDQLPLPPNSFVYDLVYTPSTTRLMTQAQEQDCEAVNGLGMLVGQGVAAYKLFTGVRPSFATMRQALNGEH